jgi:hypothetical protein
MGANRRIAATMMYLNDDFDGGETEFLYQSLRVKPVKGMVLIWPAGFTHVHRGNPPLNKDKYIGTGWYTYHISEKEWDFAKSSMANA